MPLVSIVIATNRVGPFFADALASAAAQTYSATEIIVVNDGAPDSAEVEQAVSSLDNARVIHQVPAGVSVARNVGIAQACGEYLAFLDDDDRWHPQRLEIQIAQLITTPDAVVSYCGMRTIDEHGAVLAEADQEGVASKLDIARRSTGIILPNTIMRRAALTAVGGFHSGIRLAEDLDLILRLAERGQFVFSPKTLVEYRTHSGNTTRQHRALVLGIERVLRLHRDIASERGDDDLVAALEESLRKNRRFAWWGAGRAAKKALSQYRPLAAAEEFRWALATAPSGLIDGGFRRLTRR